MPSDAPATSAGVRATSPRRVRTTLAVAVAALAALVVGTAGSGHAGGVAGPPVGTIMFEVLDCTSVEQRRGGVCGVWTVDLGTGARRYVSRGRNPVWSPDGRTIAFVLGRDLWTMRANGSAKRRITGIGGLWCVTWSPDGRIALTTGRETIAVIDADGSRRRTLARASDMIAWLSWSPAGDQLAYSTVDLASHPAAVYLLGPDDWRPRYVAEGSDPVWSRDGLQIAYVVGPNELGASHQIHLVRADGTDVRVLSRSEASDTQPAWSPNGRELAFVRDEDILYRIRPDGTGLHRVVTGTVRFLHEAPAWSPGGRWIAYAGDDGALYVVRPDGTGRRKIAESGYRPQWRPAMQRR